LGFWAEIDQIHQISSKYDDFFSGFRNGLGLCIEKLFRGLGAAMQQERGLVAGCEATNVEAAAALKQPQSCTQRLFYWYILQLRDLKRLVLLQKMEILMILILLNLLKICQLYLDCEMATHTVLLVHQNDASSKIYLVGWRVHMALS
jgi:hypothetical protein